jgi:hypothetical protein
MTAWLKVIGTTQWPLRDDWANHAPPLMRSASFAKKPGAGSFVPGDDFVYYALRGDISRLVAIGKVVGNHRFDKTRVADPGWPWVADVEILAKRDLIRDGFALDLIDVDRNLRRSVTQKSHIRLRPGEFTLARKLFEVD